MSGVLCTLALASPAGAVEFCVGTVAELDTALIVAGSPTGQTTTIRLRQGTYHVGGSRLLEEHTYRAVQLLGGYGADCATRSLVAGTTVIDGDGGTHHGMTLLGDTTIEGLRFQNLHGIAGAFYLYVSNDAENVLVRVRNNEFRGVGATISYYEADGGGASFQNNLVVDAPHDGLLLQFDHDDEPGAGVVGNTIVRAGGRGIAIESSSDYLGVYDNIAWGSGTRDIWIESDDDPTPGEARLHSNLYGTLFGIPAAGSGGALHDDPQFVGANNFRLQPTSPAVNSGTTAIALSDVDLDGHARVIGSTVDRGAYEAIVDDTVPQALTVTTTNDSGPGSLRQALLDANANPDFSFVGFDIPGACPRTITLASALPAMNQGLRIDAYSQPGSAANTRASGDNAVRCVVLDGHAAIGVGLDFSGPTTTQFWLQGIAIEGFTSAGLRVGGGSAALVWGNQFGGMLAGQPLAPNGDAIVLTAVADGASVGGDFPAQRNVIAGASGAGVRIGAQGFFASSGNTIAGNLIGSWGGGTGAAGNGVGVRMSTSGNTVRDNVIVNSTGNGVQLDGAGAHDNRVEHNRIGRTEPVCGLLPGSACFELEAGNGGHGVRIAGGAHDNSVSSNSVWHSGGMGLSVGDAGQRNRLSANSVYRNHAWGIDLDGSGLNDNDADAAAQTQPNRGRNYPVLARAWGGPDQGWVEGDLDSIDDTYQIQVFSSAQPDNEPTGEGERFHRTGLAYITGAPAGQNGHAHFRIAFTGNDVDLAGRSITAVAIDSDGNSSEFSVPVTYLCDVIFRNAFDDALPRACAPP